MKTASVTLKWAYISGLGLYRGRQVDDSRGVRNYLFHLHMIDNIFPEPEVWSRRALLLLHLIPSAPAMSIVQKAIIIIPVITAVTVFILSVTAGITTSLAWRKERLWVSPALCPDKSNIPSRRRLDFVTRTLHRACKKNLWYMKRTANSKNYRTSFLSINFANNLKNVFFF